MTYCTSSTWSALQLQDIDSRTAPGQPRWRAELTFGADMQADGRWYRKHLLGDFCAGISRFRSLSLQSKWGETGGVPRPLPSPAAQIPSQGRFGLRIMHRAWIAAETPRYRVRSKRPEVRNKSRREASLHALCCSHRHRLHRSALQSVPESSHQSRQMLKIWVSAWKKRTRRSLAEDGVMFSDDKWKDFELGSEEGFVQRIV